MKHALQIVAVFVATLSASGCATPYMVDRGRDLADIFTATTGYGIGAKARVGPVAVAPFLAQNDSSGLRGGAFFQGIKGGLAFADGGITDVGLLCFSGDAFGDRRYHWWQTNVVSILEQRGKTYEAAELWIPFIAVPRTPDTYGYPLYYFTQIEVVVAVGRSVRLGFNPGELLDFILGWTTIDIFGDDLEAKKKRNSRTKVRTVPK